MKHPLAVIAVTMLAGPALAQSIPLKTPVPGTCRQDAQLVADSGARSGSPLRVTPLDREPDAAVLAAVWRRDSRGCPQPVVLKRGVGNARR